MVDDEDKSSKQPTSYPPMGGMTSTGGVARVGSVNTEIVNSNENVSIQESKTVNIVTPDPQVKGKDGIAHNTVHVKDVAEMNKWYDKNDKMIALAQEQIDWLKREDYSISVGSGAREPWPRHIWLRGCAK